ncbi:protein MLN51 homolog [Lycium barbarum]|uniref:protein MLN51 homolog n=1 Tax=Lycium barbarum TaxID=112863 RepID=UPI00293ED1AA|nr:protein MLN51 homolog [Lycium barbarum]
MMAGVEEKDVEYESDPEETKLSLTTRRREASDDEGEKTPKKVDDVEYESDEEEAKLSLKMRRREASDDEEGEKTEKPLRRVDSDDESEGQGGAAEYDEEEIEEEYVDEGNEESGVVEEEDGVVKEVLGELRSGMEDGSGVVLGEEKKVNEPYAVPTAGAFYMHDDRFRDNAGGRHRRTFGGRKLWESKDDWKWGHDKFEELTVEERHYEEGRRTSRGRYRGRGRARGAARGTSQGRRPKAYINDYNQSTNNNQKIQNSAPKGMRGRGPSRYRPTSKENIDASPMYKQSGQSVEKLSDNSSSEASAPVSDLQNDGITSVKQNFASSLNYASPPFYPSSSSTKENTVTHKRDLQTGTSSHRVQPYLSGKSSAAAQSTAMLRGKDVRVSTGIDKLKIDDSISADFAKLPSNLQMPPGASSVYSNKQPQRGQGRGFNTSPHMNYQYPPNNQGNRVSQPTKLHSTQRNSAQTRGQPSLQGTQQLAQQAGTGSQSSPPPRTGETVNTLHGEIASSLESGKLSAMVAKGKGSLQGAGRGSAPYGGAQGMGSPGDTGSGKGDQNVSATPAYLPVMQFGGQQPGGMRAAVGMAFPGYVGQPQLGLGNSDMTWLPVLAGAAGAFGPRYCSPYFALDGAYHARSSGGPISSLTAAPSKEEDSTSKPSNERKTQQKNELTNDNSGQRQKNPRRYTEMKFDQ